MEGLWLAVPIALFCALLAISLVVDFFRERSSRHRRRDRHRRHVGRRLAWDVFYGRWRHPRLTHQRERTPEQR